MAVDVCSEISSPRISFSHDLKELDIVPIEHHIPRSDDALLLNPTVDFDFDFSVGKSSFFPQEISSADELFADGKILAVEIKKTATTTTTAAAAPKKTRHSSTHRNVEFAKENTHKKRLIEFLSTSFDADEEEEDEKPSPKPFWLFRRSSSVNGENGRGNGLRRSFQFLGRSNSTGSVPNPSKPSVNPKAIQKQHSLKEGSINRENPSAPFFNYYSSYNNNGNNNNTLRKDYLRKSNSRSYGNGVRISPVLNIPPTYIGKGTVGLFGIGSFFSSKKAQKKRK